VVFHGGGLLGGVTFTCPLVGKNAKEKVSKRLPEDVWVSNFQTSIDHCLPDKASLVKEEHDNLF